MQTPSFFPSRGFTLVELMLAIVVAAILLTVAVPSFTSVIRNNRMAAAVNALSGAIQLTRMEAIRRNARVSLCKSADGSACTNNGGLEQGWIVFAEDGTTSGNNFCAHDTNEPLLRTQQSIDNGITITDGGSGISNCISFGSDGLPLQNGTIKICDSRTGPFGRELKLIPSGRLRLEQGVSCP